MKKIFIRILVSAFLSALVALTGGVVYSLGYNPGSTQVFLVSLIFFVVSFFVMWRTD